MGLFNFWKKKVEQNSLETLVSKFEEFKKELKSEIDNYKLEKEEQLKRAEDERSKALLELEELKQKKSAEEVNNNIIIHYFPGKELYVVIQGDIIYSTDISPERHEELIKLREVKDVYGIKKLLIPDLKDEITVKEQEIQKEYEEATKSIENNLVEEKELEETIDKVHALVSNGDFVAVGDTLQMKGINRSVPAILVDRFLELWINDSFPEYEALKNFWRWIVINPNPRATEEFYELMKKYKVPVTKEGFILAYRWIQSLKTKAPNKDLIEAISNLWAKVKKSKKSPKNYTLYKDENEKEYFVYPTDKEVKREKYTTEGNLADLYNNLSSMQGKQLYTDGYTRTMKIKIGVPVTMDRRKCDESSISCSRGLHAAFNIRDYFAHGDTKMLVAICPRDIVSVPYSESKFRSCEYLPLAVLKSKDDDVTFLKSDEGLDMLDGYFQLKVEELKKQSEELTVKELTQQRLLPKRLFENKSVEPVTEEVVETEGKMEVATIVDSFEGQLSNRIQTID